jgi:hypothetical protein
MFGRAVLWDELKIRSHMPQSRSLTNVCHVFGCFLLRQCLNPLTVNPLLLDEMPFSLRDPLIRRFSMPAKRLANRSLGGLFAPLRAKLSPDQEAIRPASRPTAA